jgi:hypothetical protein
MLLTSATQLRGHVRPNLPSNVLLRLKFNDEMTIPIIEEEIL